MCVHIPVPPAPEVQPVSKEGSGPRGMVVLVEGRMLQEERASHQMYLELHQQEGKAATSVHLELLLEWLRCYPCMEEAVYLAQGFKE